MQYQIFVQSQSQQSFIASVVGISSVTTEVKTEIEYSHPIPQMKYAGILANDPSFDDFMEKLTLICEQANLEVDI
ncbi:type II toxin-antitoxin system HicB family antitoxin [Pseudanabaena sp. ABRG5-3]|uniref:type II toxin-antitoxin system HicB family antitoxin n=1 Tax=Pseudanabaena sp. ABRG5-3 TaxID=685565 RepID=UPI000DC70E39|nr:type II toxin-antitoxin system HicB family antitoxin [Pseudanabaena sp. ABRG5-3]BBC22752.1 hypothetical protein ABRG53_0495 [Pseudanabaena sp. ABRG5-3]